MANIIDSQCVLVVGSAAEIGRTLALLTVIVCSRCKERLDELVALHIATGRLKSVTLDVLSERNVLKSSIEDIVNTYPDHYPMQIGTDRLSRFLFSNGIQRAFDFTKPEAVYLESLKCELATNYTSIVRMIAFFLPHLIELGQGHLTFLYTVYSGLSIVLAAGIIDYCATKSTIHDLSISLAAQPIKRNNHVVEIILS
ncbi:hypothetical protein DFJ58DRAFT_671800 [Suillus subalutaceus]|uniref:uncharacterized protein n=1 Tax=Suillus subalutaceus TaxID=48586 RepID=UPI001B86E382|nr:uncharacterized protein DFJ58DRAFT_671800 [Suillus subalutaceus]KAG1829707.1 hypothetical protein DFJ58DRAFT_671800 [Suillus subalutaceus]